MNSQLQKSEKSGGRKQDNDFGFLATGIGSVPFLDIRDTCRMILEHFPRAPFWPQFPRRSFLEGMIVQFSEGLPLLEMDEERKGLLFSTRDKASELTRFYEHFLAEDVEYFAMSRDFAPGFHEMISLLGEEPGDYGPYVKGQCVGPVTFCTAVRDSEGLALIHDPECLEAVSKGLAMKALWQADKLQKLGKKSILFLDEPSLSGFGSAFSPIERHEVIRLLSELMAYVRERRPVKFGIHCCGNTDWSMLFDAGPDIISFDAYTYLEYFLLYRDRICRFLEEGGSIAWGIVPTGEPAGGASLDTLLGKLRQGLDRLSGPETGLDKMRRRSLLTPACGMGNMEESAAAAALDLLRDISGVGRAGLFSKTGG